MTHIYIYISICLSLSIYIYTWYMLHNIYRILYTLCYHLHRHARGSPRVQGRASPKIFNGAFLFGNTGINCMIAQLIIIPSALIRRYIRHSFGYSFAQLIRINSALVSRGFPSPSTLLARPRRPRHDNSIYIYIYIYIYTHIYIYNIYIYIYIYIYTYIHTYIHVYVCIYIYIYTHIHTYIHTHTHTYIHACIHTFIHINTHICSFVYIS